MSMHAVADIAQDLPRPIAAEVLGYARSVQSALPEIFQDAGISEDRELGDRLVLIAGFKKIRSLISSQFWTLDSSLHLMREADVAAVRIGSLEISRGSDYHRRLQEAVRELDQILADADVTELLEIRSYSELALRLRHGR